jgi:hypothetical protein
MSKQILLFAILRNANGRQALYVWLSESMTEWTNDLTNSGYSLFGLSGNIGVGPLQVGSVNDSGSGSSQATRGARPSPLQHLLRSKGVTICPAFKF